MRVLTGIMSLQLIRNITEEFKDMWKQVLTRLWPRWCRAVLMVMVKLYHNINFSFLSVLFSIHRMTVSGLLKCCICILPSILRGAVFFPLKESVRYSLTSYCIVQKHTSDTDCTQIVLERPGDLPSCILTYGRYKGYTLKVLVGCAPSGMITFIGTGFGKQMSDSCLTKESVLLDQCMPYVAHVMVDQGSPIENLCDDACIKINRFPIFMQTATNGTNWCSQGL